MPGRGRLPCRLFAVEERGCGSVIDTRFQTSGFEEALSRNLLPLFLDYRVRKKNVRLGRSLDYELVRDEETILVEERHPEDRGLASYPGCPTESGRRHLRELIAASRKGKRGALFFLMSLKGVKGVMPNQLADP